MGLGGETFGSAGFQWCRFANLVQCPPTPFGDGTRAFTHHWRPQCLATSKPQRRQPINSITSTVCSIA
ncbi:hypothetical protein C6Q14_28255 [Burkholderia ambifaria]|nr:hypothetical protein C6Q14_28255 [Burkholderia ambifaria]